ncbi:transcription initiation factor IIA subunit 1 [Anabrus simplex]|uniref:transcription initiation factor IIA subunit 1 n=1 Tax=Anabrus simplex TaxID=316456 RepID=UPI0035A388D4
MTQSQANVLKLYRSVIEDVITGVRDAFLDEGVDEQVLQELRQIWETKLISSKAVELNPDPPEPQPPQIGIQKELARNNIASKPVQQMAVYPISQQTTLGVSHVHQTAPVLQQANHQQHIPQQQQLQQQQAMQQMSHQQTALPQQQAQQQQQTVPQQQMAPTQQTQQPTQQTVIVTDPTKQVPIQITLPAQGGGEPRILTIQVPASALQGNQLHSVLTGPVISATMALPPQLASTLLQQHVTAALQGQAASLRQVDGAADTSDEDEDEDDDEDIDDDDENEDRDEDENEEENNEGAEEEPLNSGDDVSDEDPSDLFDTDNVVVCQYDKITRSRNKWKFYLKDGIMNLNSKDYVFQKASGDAEW